MGVAGGVDNLPWLWMGTLVGMTLANPPFAALVARLTRVRFISDHLPLLRRQPPRVPRCSSRRRRERPTCGWAACSTSGRRSSTCSSSRSSGRRSSTSSRRSRASGSSASSPRAPRSAASWARRLTAVPGVGARRRRRCCWCRRCSSRSPCISHAPPHARGRRRQRAAGRPRSRGRSAAARSPGLTHALRSPYLLAISAYMLLFTILSTFLYFQQAAIVDRTLRRPRGADAVLRAGGSRGERADAGDPVVPDRTAARMARRHRHADAAAAAHPRGLRLARRHAHRRGHRRLPGAAARRQLRRGPARHAKCCSRWSGREDKYKAKSFIDTFVYRVGDQLGAWSYALMTALGLGVAGVAWVGGADLGGVARRGVVDRPAPPAGRRRVSAPLRPRRRALASGRAGSKPRLQPSLGECRRISTRVDRWCRKRRRTRCRPSSCR